MQTTGIEFENAIQTLESLRDLVEKTYRESQETGNFGKANLAMQRLRLRLPSIRMSQPDAFAEWLKGNARFLQAVQENRNPILC